MNSIKRFPSRTLSCLAFGLQSEKRLHKIKTWAERQPVTLCSPFKAYFCDTSSHKRHLSSNFFSDVAITKRLQVDLNSNGFGVVIYPALENNYGFILVTKSLDAIVVDTPDASALIDVCHAIHTNGINMNIQTIVNTHGHPGKQIFIFIGY